VTGTQSTSPTRHLEADVMATTIRHCYGINLWGRKLLRVASAGERRIHARHDTIYRGMWKPLGSIATGRGRVAMDQAWVEPLGSIGM
jgi:hypothetical protein